MWLSSVAQPGVQPECLERWRAGCIVVRDGRLDYITRRWWGYRASWLRIGWDRLEKRMRSRAIPGPLQRGHNVCKLYYHHSWMSADFLILGYIKSSAAATFSSFYVATLVLDEVARIKRSNAIVAEINNDRISDRLLRRWGWERHCPELRGRHYIKRFYGTYPPQPEAWQTAISP